MSEMTEQLEAGEAEMHAMIGTTFTVEGRSGSFTGLLDTASLRINPGVDGMRGEDMAVLSCLKSAGYRPNVGDVITIEDHEWRVSEVRGGVVKWELTLMGINE